MRGALLGLVLALAPAFASAQQQVDPAQAAIMLSLALQKNAVQAQDFALMLAAMKNRIAELEQLCGEACKQKPEAK